MARRLSAANENWIAVATKAFGNAMGGGYRHEVGATEPDFEIDDFRQLEKIVMTMLENPDAVKTVT